MPASILLGRAPASRKNFTSASAVTSHDGDCATALGVARTALAAHRAEPENRLAWFQLVASLHRAADLVAQNSRGQVSAELIERVARLVVDLNDTVAPARLAAEDPTEVIQVKSWPGLLATMLLRPAWACPRVAPLDRVPEWLWADYAAWLMAVPKSFAAPRQADRFAAYWESQVSELSRWVEANPAAAVVKAKLECYLAQSALPALRPSGLDLRKGAELHARLVSRLERKTGQAQPPILVAREGRRLRVGFVFAVFDGSPEMQAAVPMIEHLDPDRFEVEVFVFQATDSRWEQHARKVVRQLQLMPSTLSEQVEVIVQAGLDVLVYAADLTADRGDPIKLATQRLAPLQVATSSHHASTTGCGTIDLFVAGDLSDLGELTAQFGERVGLMCGPTRAFAQIAAEHEVTTQWTRADFNLPENTPAFVAAANWREITPETQVLWAGLLTQLPDCRLLVQRIGSNGDGAAEARQLGAALERRLAAQGVTDDRLMVSPSELPSPADLEALFKVGDVFLDVCPSQDESAALSALKAGLPVVTMAGPAWRSRRVAALLKSLGLAELVATDPAGYAALAVRFATDAQARSAVTGRIRRALEASPAVLDALALGDGFGDLIEVAFDEILAAGGGTFRANRTPLRLPVDAVSPDDHLAAGAEAWAQGDYFIALAEARSALRADPASHSARALLGRSYLGLEQPQRAVEYLLAAVESGAVDASCWFDLARALNLNQQSAPAVQALEACLRLDPRFTDGWLMLIELAEAIGAADLAREAFDTLGVIAPEHPRLEELRCRFDAAPLPTA